MVKCIAYYNKCDSISRIITGLISLEKAGYVQLQLIENEGNFRNTPSVHIVEIEIDGKLLAFDMGDRWALCSQEGEKYLERVDGYFARDYSSEINIVTPKVFLDNEKVRPFGFNYYVTCRNNPIDNPKSIKQFINKSIRDISGYSRCMYPESFEGKANWKDKNISVIFMARLWDTNDIVLDKNLPQDVYDYREYMLCERTQINKRRIEIIRQLKREYGDAFTGGVYYDAVSQRECPDLTLSRNVVRKKAYVERMKDSDICIGSMGLHRSIGWKTGEYIAAARAIVSERFNYEVPGNFDDGRHYLPFDTVDGCLAAVASLYSNPNMLYEMKKANEMYYLQYLKIEQQILNALRYAGISF